MFTTADAAAVDSNFRDGIASLLTSKIHLPAHMSPRYIAAFEITSTLRITANSSR